MYCLPILCLMFLIGAIYNAVARDVVPWHNVAVGGGIALAYGLAFLYLLRCDREEAAFYAWLEAQDVPLEEGPGTFDGVAIHPDTPVLRHTVVVSFAFVTVTEDPGFRFAAQGGAARGLAYALITLLFGWWALPRGPLDSVRALTTDLRGGRLLTLDEHIALRCAEDDEVGADEDDEEA